MSIRKMSVTLRATMAGFEVTKVWNTLQWVPGDVFSKAELQKIMQNNQRVDFQITKA